MSNKISTEDKYWLMGLFEGEGYFVISRSGYDGKFWPSFRIGIEMNEDVEYFKYIQNLIGGCIFFRKNRPKSVQLVVRKKEEIINFYENFKDLKWRAKKGLQFKKFFDRFFEYSSKKYGERLGSSTSTVCQDIWGKKGEQ